MNLSTQPLCYGLQGMCMWLALVSLSHAGTLSYPIVDTAQTSSYDNHRQIANPQAGKAFFGQDAQFKGNVPNYRLSSDGLTVQDLVTGLTWQRSPDTNRDGTLNGKDKMTLAQALKYPEQLNASRFGGYNDWRLPTIKELYSLILFSGIDPSGPDMNSPGLKPFLDTRFFQFAYGKESDGDRIIDSQYASCTKYVAKSWHPGADKMFGVNFADGRIKGYDLNSNGPRPEKSFFVQCVRGNPGYGKNEFRDNGEGTVTDRATGLEWSKADSGKGMNWEAALAWVQEKNAQRYLGHNDWRLPNAKELQSIVDYSRSPDTSNSPALAPVFECTSIKNELGQNDYPYFWSSTSHVGLRGAIDAVYLAFGRAAGWMGQPGAMGPGFPSGPQNGSRGSGKPDSFRRGHGFGGPGGPGGGGMPGAEGGGDRYVDIHGAGAQRSDPKAGKASDFPKGRGPQGDVVRIDNFVRLVRGE